MNTTAVRDGHPFANDGRKPHRTPSDSRLTHRLIEVFRVTMNAGTLTLAAQALHTSQPTVSREIARLEQVLGLRLFDRVRGRLQPREQAIALLKEIQLSYIGLERIAAAAARLRETAEGDLSVVCLPSVSHTLLPGACARFLSHRRGIHVSVVQQESPYLEEWLAMGRSDVGLGESPNGPSGTTQELLMELPQVAVLSPRHPLLKRRALHLKDFDGQRFISLAPGDPSRLFVDGLFREHGIRREMVLDTQNALSLCAMVSHGLGIGIVNPLTARLRLGAALAVRPLAFMVPFRVYLSRALYRPAHPLMDEFIVALQQEVASQQAAVATLFG